MGCAYTKSPTTSGSNTNARFHAVGTPHDTNDNHHRRSVRSPEVVCLQLSSSSNTLENAEEFSLGPSETTTTATTNNNSASFSRGRRRDREVEASLSKSSSFSSSTSSNNSSMNQSSSVSAKYTRVKTIGSGMFGVVYLATDKRSGKLCAVKGAKDASPNVSNSGYVFSPLVEVENLLRCRGCPCILQIIEAILSNHKVWIVTEYIPGFPWGSSQHRLGPVPNTPATIDVIRNVLFDVLRALRFLHDEVHMAHMDIKPENILVLRDPVENVHAKLIDLGSAIECGSGHERTTCTAGTWYYSSPEKLRSQSYCPKKADIWALGVTTAVAVFGNDECPFPKEWTRVHSVFVEQIRNLVTPVCIPTMLRNEPTPPDLLDIMNQMLIVDPERRPSASTLLDHPAMRSIMRMERVVSVSDLF